MRMPLPCTVSRNNRTALRFEIIRTASLNGDGRGFRQANRCRFAFPHGVDGRPNDSLVAAYSALHNQTVNIADAYTAAEFDFSGTRRFDAHRLSGSQSFLTVPMKDHEGDVIGVLQLINATDPAFTGRCAASAPQTRAWQSSLASQAAIAITNRGLMTQLESLFESFISLINVATIDRKSSLTPEAIASAYPRHRP